MLYARPAKNTQKKLERSSGAAIRRLTGGPVRRTTARLAASILLCDRRFAGKHNRKFMNTILPILSVVALVGLRLVELGTNRKTVAGPIKEHLTFWLFMFSGLFLFIFGITEFLMAARGVFWPTYAAGV